MPMPIRVYTVYVSALISTAIRSRTRAVLVNLLRWKYFVLFHLRWHRYSENRFCRNDIKYFHKRRLAAARVKGSVRNVQKSERGGQGCERQCRWCRWMTLRLSLSVSIEIIVNSIIWTSFHMNGWAVDWIICRQRETLTIYGPLWPFRTFSKWKVTSINCKCHPKMNNQFGRTHILFINFDLFCVMHKSQHFFALSFSHPKSNHFRSLVTYFPVE